MFKIGTLIITEILAYNKARFEGEVIPSNDVYPTDFIMK